MQMHFSTVSMERLPDLGTAIQPISACTGCETRLESLHTMDTKDFLLPPYVYINYCIPPYIRGGYPLHGKSVGSNLVMG